MLLRALQRFVSVKTRNEQPAAAAAAINGNGNAAVASLTWNDFFKYRKQLRSMGLRFGLPAALVFLMVEMNILSQPLYDPTMTAFGYDPSIFLGLATIGGLASSYVTGASLAR